jgi:hypothetical protein
MCNVKLKGEATPKIGSLGQGISLIQHCILGTSPTMGFTHHKTVGEHYHEFTICKDLLKISSVFGGNVQEFVYKRLLFSPMKISHFEILGLFFSFFGGVKLDK